MATIQILSTQDYSLFVDHEYQRKISTKHVNSLAESMRAHGFMYEKPVQVYKRDGKLHVIDGHHRVRAAQIAGVPIYYVVSDESAKELLAEINEKVLKWKVDDFVVMYADKGIDSYIKLIDYVGKGIPLDTLIAWLNGTVSGGKDLRVKVRNGTFEIKTTKMVDNVLATFDQIGKLVPQIKKSAYCEALAAVISLPEFDIKLFWDKVRISPLSLVSCTTRDQALGVIEEVYNFRNHRKVNLSFLAKESIRLRQEKALGWDKKVKVGA